LEGGPCPAPPVSAATPASMNGRRPAPGRLSILSQASIDEDAPAFVAQPAAGGDEEPTSKKLDELPAEDAANACDFSSHDADVAAATVVTPSCKPLQRRRPPRMSTPQNSQDFLTCPGRAAATSSFDVLMVPDTPDPQRCDMKLIAGDVAAIMFDFDGTLTASPGDHAQRSRKQIELLERSPLLAPRLKRLRESGIILGIISKSSECTIRGALQEAGLTELFNGPLIFKAVGLEGKAGFINDLVQHERFNWCGPSDIARVLLVDDDVRELDRARQRGIQTYASPSDGGLQEEDFDQIFAGLGLRPRSPGRASPPRHWSPALACSPTPPAVPPPLPS